MNDKTRRFNAVFISISLIFMTGVFMYYVDNPSRSYLSPAEVGQPKVDESHTDLGRIAKSVEAIEKGQNSKRNEEREQRSIDAQEGSWRWAKWTAWAAFLQLVLSAVGIYSVIATLRQGKESLRAARKALNHANKANEIARETLENQLRPWLSISIISRPKMDIVNSLPRIDAILKIENKGQTPAVEISYAAVLCVGYHPEIEYLSILKHQRNEYLGFIGDIFQGDVIEHKARIEHVGEPLSSDVGYIIATVFYKSTSSDNIRETSVFWKIEDKRSADDLIDFSQPIPENCLHLRVWNELPGLVK